MPGAFKIPGFGREEQEEDRASPAKRGPADFAGLLRRNIRALIKLNLLCIAFSLLIVTAGPAVSALCRQLRELAEGRRIEVGSGFWEAFTKAFGKSVLFSVLWLISAALGGHALSFYWSGLLAGRVWMLLPLALALAMVLLVIFAGFYLFLMAATVDMPAHRMLLAAVRLAISGLPANAICAVCIGAAGITLMRTPFLAMAFYMIIGFALSGLLIVYLCWPRVKAMLLPPGAGQACKPAPQRESD